jgi:hypothetical protein
MGELKLKGLLKSDIILDCSCFIHAKCSIENKKYMGATLDVE